MPSISNSIRKRRPSTGLVTPRDEGRGAAADAAIDSSALRPEERQRLSDEVGQSLLPRAGDGSRRVRPAVEGRLHGIARLDSPLDAACGEVEREPSRALVPLGVHTQEIRMALVVDEPPRRVDEPEAAVAHDAGRRELDLVGTDDVQRLHGRDADPCDPALHAANLATGV
jgi:hypothetical protein